MSRRVLAGVGRVLPGQAGAFRQDLAALAGTGGADGFVLLDPGDGLRPIELAAEILRVAPRAQVVVPLVARDANRTALLGEARSAEHLGARGLVLLAGHLDPRSLARAVYDLDPLHLLRFLRDEGVGLELWAAGRCDTGAARARAAALAGAGVARCLVPWEPGDALPEPGGAPLGLVAWVGEGAWSRGEAPKGPGDLLLECPPGRGSEARAAAEQLRGAS